MKRYLAIFLILLGIAAVIFAIWMIVIPTYQAVVPTQPPPINSQPLQPEVPTPTPTPTPAPVVKPAPPIDQSELRVQESAKRAAIAFVSRAQTGSNLDGFEAMRQATVDANATVRAFLEEERKKLVADHPKDQGSWGMTTRALTARIDNLPAKGSQQVLVTVEAQLTVEVKNVPEPVDIARYQVAIQPSGEGWIVTRLERLE